jgi:hypothetical protein
MRFCDFDESESRVTFDDAFTEIEGIMAPNGDAMVFAATRGRPPRLMRRDLRTGRTSRCCPRAECQDPKTFPRMDAVGLHRADRSRDFQPVDNAVDRSCDRVPHSAVSIQRDADALRS